MSYKLICVVVTVLLAAGCLFGQTSQAMKANVPFGFQAGGVKFPAGVVHVDTQVNPNVIRIVSPDSKRAAMILLNSWQQGKGDTRAKLVFHRYGESYFLAQVWMEGDLGRQLGRTAAEKEAAIAAVTKPTKATVLLAGK